MRWRRNLTAFGHLPGRNSGACGTSSEAKAPLSAALRTTASRMTRSSSNCSSFRTPEGVTDGLRRVGGRLDRIGRIDAICRWWTQAANEARFRLLQRVCGKKTSQEGDPTLAELQLAILLAEAAAGE